MYLFPLYGHIAAARISVREGTKEQTSMDAQTCAASTTLLCLNGLKSSLI